MFYSVAWSASLGIVLLTFRDIRKNTSSTGFVVPGSQFPNDDEEAFAPSDTETPNGGGYRASGDYYAGEGEGRLFGERVQGYGGGGQGVRDPFEDPTSSTDYAARYDGADPYEAIRKVSLVSFERAIGIDRVCVWL